MRSLVSKLSPALLACVALLTAGCGKGSGGARLGGESHFLGNCTQGCGALSCIAGVCTLPCAEASACGDLNVQAVCRIEAGEIAGFCDVACSEEGACPDGSELSCQAGYCRSGASFDAGVSSVLESNTSPEASSSMPRTPSGLPLRCVDSTTLVDDVSIENQAELEALEGCEVIDGDLSLSGATDLRPLHALRRVVHVLSLGGRLTSLAGLEQLESIRELQLDNLTVSEVPTLPRLRVLAYLTVENTNLEDLSLIRDATGISWLNLLSNPVLASLNGLSSDQLVNVHIDGNPVLTDLRGLSRAPATIDLSIRDSGIQNFDGLSQLSSIYSLVLEHDSQLQNLDALANVEFTNTLAISGCSSLTHLPEFSRTTELNTLHLTNNEKLEIGSSFSALQHHTANRSSSGFYEGTLLIQSDGSSRVEFPQLETGNVEISGNNALSVLSFPKLREGGLIVESNPQLAALALPALTQGLVGVLRNERISAVDIPLLVSQPEALSTLVIALNPALESSAIHFPSGQGWRVVRVGGNAGVAGTGDVLRSQLLEPCPWEGDGICDQCPGAGNELWTGLSECGARLCAYGTDAVDCALPADAGP